MTTVEAVSYSPVSKENDATRNKKEKTEVEPLVIGDMESAKEIADKLIAKHHHDLASANFIYLCRNKSAKRGGKPVPGHVKKASPTERHISRHYFQGLGDGDEEVDFVITIALDVWNNLLPNQRTATLDHLLTHCQAVEDEKTGAMKYSVRAPTVQEFPDICERYGRWNDDLVELGRSLANS